jgi:hypothetical protein
MALEGMHHELLSHLRAKRVPPAVISDWETAWSSAVKRSGSLLPCPECILAGKVSCLEPRAGFGQFGLVQCRVCHSKFMFPEK